MTCISKKKCVVDIDLDIENYLQVVGLSNDCLVSAWYSELWLNIHPDSHGHIWAHHANCVWRSFYYSLGNSTFCCLAQLCNRCPRLCSFIVVYVLYNVQSLSYAISLSFKSSNDLSDDLNQNSLLWFWIKALPACTTPRSVSMSTSPASKTYMSPGVGWMLQQRTALHDVFKIFIKTSWWLTIMLKNHGRGLNDEYVWICHYVYLDMIWIDMI